MDFIFILDIQTFLITPNSNKHDKIDENTSIEPTYKIFFPF
ncbi:hypothetical protein NARC_30123 [Candidatus Nitrosocosmicus arcticus]|uniref:Uncharacterized protein n=1 Tax=Candidatus Nitrosocosmicus arcticus TaxID=2035267 RepID=A0A557SXS4_9ARCH|nr:hypothetical protein NARC_30123 [Candidatus Nitrosocosmicus arcticus]